MNSDKYIIRLKFLYSNWQHWCVGECWITWLLDSAILFQTVIEIQLVL